MATSFQSQLLNFRKMKHEFSPQILRDGKILYDKHAVVSSTIAQFTDNSVKISSQVQGNFGNNYCCEIEIDRHESEILDSNCDCPHHSDCMHLACLLIHLENHFEALVVQHFDGKNKKKIANAQDPKSAQLKKVLQHAEKKEQARKEKEREKEDLQDYCLSAELLGRSAFFVPEEEFNKEQGELSLLFVPIGPFPFKQIEVQIAIRLPFFSACCSTFLS